MLNDDELDTWARMTRMAKKSGATGVKLNLQDWPRADPAELERFDPATKVCVMNCGPAEGDPRSAAERKLLCSDCEPAQRRPIPQAITPTMLALAMSEDGEGFDEDDFEFPGEFEDF
jgi:hypothetical protein